MKNPQKITKKKVLINTYKNFKLTNNKNIKYLKKKKYFFFFKFNKKTFKSYFFFNRLNKKLNFFKKCNYYNFFKTITFFN